MKRAALLAVLLLLQIGCAAPASPKELNYPVCQRLVNAELVTVEVILVNGCKTIDRSLEKAIEGFSKYVGGEVRTVQGKPVELQVDKNGLLKRGQLKPIIAKSRYRGPSDITILLVPGLSDYGHRGHYEPLRDGHHLVVIQTKHVAKGAPPLLSPEIWWHLVIKHELCHALAVPFDRCHAWSGRHCIHPECILYPRVDWRAIGVAILRLGPPMDLCGVCRRQIRQAQEAAGGKLVDPKEPYDHLKWLDELVELNPDARRAYAGRAYEYSIRKDYDKAIADLTRAIELDPKNATHYRIRGQVFGLAGQLEHSISDYERCLELKGDDAVALNNLAWLLATCHKDGVLDGLRAVKLARRACELTELKPPEFLGTLAAAYAECGQFDKAVEYQNKAISLADENRVAPYRQRLELYRSGKPCRGSKNSVTSLRESKSY